MKRSTCISLALAAFLAAPSVRAQCFPAGTATLSWTPPTRYTDGSLLTQLAGYRVYYGVQQGYYPNSLTVGPSLATVVINRLPTARYYFVMTAVDSLGTESAYSNVASANVVSPCVTKPPMNLLNDTALLTAIIIGAIQQKQ